MKSEIAIIPPIFRTELKEIIEKLKKVLFDERINNINSRV